MTLDETHDPALRSWVPGADEHPDFPIQNLPLGVFCPADGAMRPGVAIGDQILDLRAVQALGLIPPGLHALEPMLAEGTLNDFLAQGAPARVALRRALSTLLRAGADPRPDILHDAAACTMALPARIGDYTDFYAGIHHAQAVGRLLRPAEPLLPNYKWMPVAYHGRAGSVGVPGQVRRPSGQRKPAREATPSFGPSRNLDYELELAIWVGTGAPPGAAVPASAAATHIAGYGLLNDWSARDIQGWEAQPLGPFLGKSFCTTVSPWIITPEALAPFRAPQPARPEGDPAPLPYLLDPADQAEGALALRLEAWLQTPLRRASGVPPHRLSASSALDLYWTPVQMLTHHASNGCGLRPGDLFGSGTISGPEPDGAGSLLELTAGGRAPVVLEGETRRFLEDGDEIVLTARAERGGFVSIGFGPCGGVVVG